ncbi:AAA domain-containing protein [Streptomyces sp. CB02923]|uniref:AAA domain-containing protein n=1 Tax=Streptomyces sp. CB02923 TaxID=1718985 RepID=UPI001F5B5C33|nr:AAA domain-containing protein [Streptomyces sp. CB02923]
MTRRLTVATGPPGTGKSQLVANLVATAISAGQTVLVASTNNEAVDEVWRRCDTLVPGSIVRTGSARKNAKSNTEHEAAAGCLALAGFAAAEREWNDGRQHAASVDDTALARTLRDAEKSVQDASRARRAQAGSASTLFRRSA